MGQKSSEENMQNEWEQLMQQLVWLEQSEDMDEFYLGLQKLLETIGKDTNADRAFLFESMGQTDVFSNTVEWCAAGISPQSQYLQKLYAGEMPYWYQTFVEGKTIVIEDMEAISQTMPNEYAILKVQGVETEIAIPLRQNNKVRGFFGLDNPDMTKAKHFLTLMQVVGMHLGSIWANKIKDRDLQLSKDRLQQKKRELEREQLILEILSQEYTSVYYVDLYTEKVDVIKLNILSNAAKFIDENDEKNQSYSALINTYAEGYVLDIPEIFKERLGISNLKEELSQKAKISFRYQTIPNQAGQQFFEAQAVCMKRTPKKFDVMVGFRYIDDIIARERKSQRELQAALQEVALNNEIISAIGKTYFCILRLDLGLDYFEEVSQEGEVHRLTGIDGVASVKMAELCDAFVTPEYQQAVRTFMDLSTVPERLKTDDTVAMEYPAKDGNWHLARFIAKKRDKEGNVTHVLYVVHLISDTKRREQKLIVMAEEARQENEAKTEFLSRMAHDIRTPMNAVKGFIGIMKANIDDPERVKNSLRQVENASEHLVQIVNDVLDLTRIEKGQMQLQEQVINIVELFDQNVITLESVMLDKQLNCQCSRHDILSEYLYLDALHIKQICMNLLSNAIKYTPAKGTIRFEMYQEALEESDNVRLHLMIQDSGIGMSEEYMEKMYQRFSRAVDTRVNQVRGSGLGLSVVKELVELLGGKIRVESQLDKGTTFYLSFDVRTAQKPKRITHDDNQKNQKDCKGMHLLVAEDNDLNYQVAQELLQMYEISCDRAENGEVCIQMFQEASPGSYQGILMDMQMPVMDGLEAAKRIRQLQTAEAKTIPIIALTANAFNQDVENCRKAGMNEHLSKPFDMDTLLALLAQYKKE